MPLQGVRTFRFKLILLITITAAVAVSLVSVILLWVDYASSRRETAIALTTQADVLAQNSEAAMAFDDREAAREVLAALRADREVAGAWLFDADGDTFASYEGSSSVPRFAPRPAGYVYSGRWLLVSTLVMQMDEGQRLGTLMIAKDMTATYDSFRNSVIIAVLLVAGITALALMVAFQLERALTRPIAELAKVASNISQTNDYSLRARLFSKDELGRFTHVFNAMIERIEIQTLELAAAREWFEVAVESSPGAMLAADPAGHIVLANAQAALSFGYSQDELIGQSVDILLPPRYRAENRGKSVFLSNQPMPIGSAGELAGLRKDGSEFPIEVGLAPVQTPGGALTLSAIVDLTERKRADERFRMAVEASPNAMVMVDQDGRIVLVNSQTESIFGYTREELIGQLVEILVPHRFRPPHPGYRDRFFTDARARPMGAGRDLFGLRKDGTEFPVEIGLSPIHSPEGIMVLSAIVDITERKRAEQVQAQQAQELARSNAELEQFVYVASHDLQEPLRAVAGCLQILQHRSESKLDERDLELMKHAVEGSSRMQQLIDDLLAYSRVGTRGQSFRPTDMNAIVQATLANLAAAIARSGAQVNTEPLPMVVADPTQMTQLMQNLVGNAIKYRSADRAPEIHIGSRRDGDYWVMWVRDNGIGIEAQYYERIFRVFQRLHTRLQYPGTGIGLAICRKIIDRHDGRIWVESEPGVGSTFFFSLPAKEISK